MLATPMLRLSEQPPLASARSFAEPRGVALLALVLVLIVAAAAAGGCDQRTGARGSLFARTGGESFVARGASIGIWYDRRPSGSIIKHGLLVLDSPARAGASSGPLGSYLVTAAPTVVQKVEDVLTDRIPAQRGLVMTFAIGEPVPVRIERIGPNGTRELVEEGRVAFLELVRR